jgi:hypothetical protein
MTTGAGWLTLGSDNAVLYCGEISFAAMDAELHAIPTSLTLCVSVTPSVGEFVKGLTNSELAVAEADAAATAQETVDEYNGSPDTLDVNGPGGWSASIGLSGPCLSL